MATIDFYPEKPVKITEEEITDRLQEYYNTESLARFVVKLCKESKYNNNIDFVLAKQVVLELMKKLMAYHKAQNDDTSFNLIKDFVEYYKHIDY